MNNIGKRIAMHILTPFFGVILVIACIGILIWNEYQSVRHIRAIDEARKEFVQVGSASVDSSNEGKIVAAHGPLRVADETVSDPLFGVSVHTARLARTVEMYQWEETQTTSNNQTRYNYTLIWSEEIIDSSGFNSPSHRNPEVMPHMSADFTAREAYMGAFALSGAQMRMLTADRVFTSFDTETAAAIGYHFSGEYLQSFTGEPQTGDIRICYTYNASSSVSVLARQTGDSFTDYIASNGVRVNKAVDGVMTGEEIAQLLMDENTLQTWIARGICAAFMILGFIFIFSPIGLIARWIPFLGQIIAAGTLIASILLGLSISLVVIAVSWVLVRPLLAAGLLAAAAALIFAFIKRRKRTA